MRALRYGLPHPGVSNRPAAAFAAAERAAAALLLSKFIGAPIGPSLKLFAAIIAADVMLSNLSAPADYFISDAGALPKLPAAMVSAGLTAAACSLSYSGRAVKACAASACPTASHRQPTAGKSAAPALAQFLAPHRGAIQESSDTSGRSHYRHRFCHLGAGTGAGNFSPTATALRLIRKKAAAYPRERAVVISAAHLPGLQLLRRLQPYLSYQGADPYRARRRKTAPVSAGALYQLSALPSYLYAAGPTVGGFYAAAAIFANAAAFGPQRRKNLQ